MNVNITLFVQCINFFTTYLFLRHVLFKPTIKIILHEAELFTKAQHEIAQEEATIAQWFHVRQSNWQEFKKHCQFNRPLLEDPVGILESSPLVFPSMHSNSLSTEAMKAECAMLIVNHLKKYKDHS